MNLTQRSNHSVVAAGPAGTMTYRHGALPKACLHPLTTPADRCVSGYEMSDHVWHRGVWFTIKFVNGANFWEESAPFGAQLHTREPTIELLSGDGARVTAELEWTSEATGIVIRERRRITHRPLTESVAAVDWQCRLEAAVDLTLDRTPYTTWGGYGGMSFRGTRELHNASLLLPGGKTADLVTGQPGQWAAMNGQLDGGRDVLVGIALIDHPANPRSPSPWYGRTAPGNSFLNAAFLFEEPMTLAAGQLLEFRYRILVCDGHFSAADLDRFAEDFRAGAAVAL